MQGKMQPAIYGKPIDKTALSYKSFIAKKFFTPREFACLLAEIDPTSFDGTTDSAQVFLAKVQSYVNIIEENIESATRLVPNDVPFGDDFVETECRQLRGFDETARGFPVAAYADLCKWLVIPFPFTYEGKDENIFAFDKKGAKWDALKHRETFSIQEFAAILVDCDDANIVVFYDEKTKKEFENHVEPYIQLLVENIKEEQKDVLDDEIPF